MAKLLNNRYRIIETLGRGGCGETFLAEDTHMPSLRKCVIKHFKPTTTDSTAYRILQQRFEREAAILEKGGQLTVQIPTLYAYFAQNHEFYLVQEWIQGNDLARVIAQSGPMSESEVVGFLKSTLRVLDIIHAEGIIHRDLKPANVVRRTSDNAFVLIDFGAVKEVLNTSVDRDGAPLTTTLVIGSLHYMAPEQTLGHPIFASDLYALGMTTIFLLTGKSPADWKLPGSPNTAWQAFVPTISASLANVINRAIQPNPQERFASAQQMQRALDPHDTMVVAPLFNPTVPIVKNNERPHDFQPSILTLLAVHAAILLIFFVTIYSYYSSRARSIEAAAAANIAKANDAFAKVNEAVNEGKIYRVVRLKNFTDRLLRVEVLRGNGTWEAFYIGAQKTITVIRQNQYIQVKFDRTPPMSTYTPQEYPLESSAILEHEPTDIEKDSALLYYFTWKAADTIDLYGPTR